jgi:hypothetical protein
VVEAVAAHGGDVQSAREYRPSFDEVFAALLSGEAVNETAGTDGAAA